MVRKTTVTGRKCPNCGSTDIIKNGSSRNGIPRYYCKTCKQNHTDNFKLKWNNPDKIKCIHCGSTNIFLKGHTRNGNQRYFCKECNRKFAIYEKNEFTEYDKKLVAFYHLKLGVSIKDLAKHLHHTPKRISDYIKGIKQERK